MTAYDNIVRALLHTGMRVQHVGSDRARSTCPVHQSDLSRTLTLSLRRGDGRALVHCFAGCEDVDVLAALDLQVRDLFDEPLDPTEKDHRPRRPAPPPASPWDEAMRSIGLRRWPPVEHVLDRMAQEARREKLASQPVVTCVLCRTETSPWRCSCGAVELYQEAAG